MHQYTIFELTEPGTYVGLRSPPNSIEQFFIAEVINKAIASEDITDTYGHYIVAGESFLEVMYLQQVASKIGKRVKYIKPKKNVLLFIMHNFS